MSSESPYNQEFFEDLQTGSRQSAREIVPLILDLIKPQSVVDVGCGDGTWLSVFKEFGIQDCLGIDGEYVDQESLQIPQEEFLAHDLKLPWQIDKTFDLVISLEVAEHLPSECAESFIDSLTKLGDVVVFSAAIPYQGGTEHINEQWPSYWLPYFTTRGYLLVDCLRKKIWDNDKVKPWYAQNILFFVKQNCLDKYPLLTREIQNTNLSQLAIVHPNIYLSKIPETQLRTPVKQPSSQTSTGGELRINENRFGSLELEITALNLFELEGSPVKEIDSGASLRVEIEYLSPNAIHAPIFGVTISREDGFVCYDTDTKVAELSLPQIQGQGKVALYLERLDLNSGQYFVDVGIYEQNWAYAYDYHWHVYPLLIRSKIIEKGIISPPRYWEISDI
ncbi:MAG: Wzt carbohydrate-binding domain-containing protein [Coleofasciculaceae cyanobacterium]